jgi:hypothetical protein
MTIIFLLLLIFLIGFIYFQYEGTIESLDQIKSSSVCPDPIYASDPNSSIVNTLLINDFMEYMDIRLHQTESDLDSINTLVAGTSFNIIIDPSNIADVSSNQKLPAPEITMDSSNPPNYGIIFKLPKGREGKNGDPGKNGLPGPTGQIGPMGPDGKSRDILVLL